MFKFEANMEYYEWIETHVTDGKHDIVHLNH